MSGLYKKIEEAIKQHGQLVMGIFATKPGGESFSYTIGNHEKGLPELLLVGHTGDDIKYVLNLLGEKLRAQGVPFDHGQLVDLGGKYPVIVYNTDEKAKLYCLQAGFYYRTDKYSVQQVVMCDTEGRYPGDEGCDEPYASQPLLTPTLN